MDEMESSVNVSIETAGQEVPIVLWW